MNKYKELKEARKKFPIGSRWKLKDKFSKRTRTLPRILTVVEIDYEDFHFFVNKNYGKGMIHLKLNASSPKRPNKVTSQRIITLEGALKKYEPV